MLEINGYIARDKDNYLYLYTKAKPVFNPSTGMWEAVQVGDYMEIDKDKFPKLKYTDEPIEVNVEIKLPRKKRNAIK